MGTHDFRHLADVPAKPALDPDEVRRALAEWELRVDAWGIDRAGPHVAIAIALAEAWLKEHG